MKIAVLVRNFNRNAGGAERYCVELSERLSENNEVHIYSQTFDEKLPTIEFRKISKYFDKPRFLNQLLFSYLTKKATSGKFDIVHSHEMVSDADIYTIHVPCFKSDWINSKGIRKFLKNLNTLLSPRKIGYLWLEKKQMQNSSKRHFISVSGYLSRNIEQCYPLIKNISIAHPGISEKFIQNESNNNGQLQSLKEELSIPESSFIILLVANNYQKKGLSTTLKALEILKKHNIYLVIAGKGEQKKTNITKSISNNIYFLGAINNMANLYCQVDLLIHPTLADTFGMAPLEAMSFKLPVIISNMKYCGFSEHINDTQALILDDPKDETELANKIDFLYENIEDRNRIAQNGFELSKKITWDNTLHQTLLAYNLINNSLKVKTK